MKKFTQPELYRAIQKYLKNVDQLKAEAIAEVTEWKYANDLMYSPIPLYDVVVRGSKQWKPAKRRWLKKQPSSAWYKHGMDAQGNVRVVEHRYGLLRLFFYADDIIDEMCIFGDGGRGTSLRRYLFENDVARMVYDYNLDPHQYHEETFRFEEDRCVGSIDQGWYLDSESKKWVSSGVEAKCQFEYDNAGLSRVYRHDGFSRSEMEVVYVRPDLVAAFKAKCAVRRPFIVYELSVNQDIYSDVYGLEMTIDNEWPIETVIVVPPDLVNNIPGMVNIEEMGVSLGATAPPADGNLKTLVADSAKWLMIQSDFPDIQSNIKSALNAGLNIIFCVTKDGEITNSLKGLKKLTVDRIVIAYRPIGKSKPATAQRVSRLLRDELELLRLGTSRIVLVAPLTEKDIMDYLREPDIDGVVIRKQSFTTVLGILSQIAIHC